jgi:hypothetical protein
VAANRARRAGAHCAGRERPMLALIHLSPGRMTFATFGTCIRNSLSKLFRTADVFRSSNR